MDSKEMVKLAVAALQDKKALDIRVIDIGEISVIADYFVMASATNTNQLSAMQDAVDEALYREGIHAKSVEGNRSSTWILLDYEDVVVHLFSQEDRLFYDLERIWQDGTEINIDDLI